MKLKKTKLEGLDFWYREDDRFIGQRIALGKYERYETALMLSQLNINSVVVDVGANIGYYTLLMAKRCKRVYAIEPDKKCFEILKKNVEENNLKNVVLINGAASDKREKKYLVRDEENLGNSRIGNKKGDLILTETLDNIVKNEQYISLLKIDTQGWEPQVIWGAKKIIERDRVTMFLEYTPKDYKNNKMINYLKKIYKNIWSINDFASVPWPIYMGIKTGGENGYTDLFLKNKMELRDYLVMLKNISYKKWIKGIMNLYVKDKRN